MDYTGDISSSFLLVYCLIVVWRDTSSVSDVSSISLRLRLDSLLLRMV